MQAEPSIQLRKDDKRFALTLACSSAVSLTEAPTGVGQSIFTVFLHEVSACEISVGSLLTCQRPLRMPFRRDDSKSYVVDGHRAPRLQLQRTASFRTSSPQSSYPDRIAVFLLSNETTGYDLGQRTAPRQRSPNKATPIES